MLLPSEQESHQIFLNTSQQKVGVERKQSPAGMLLFEPFLCSFEILNINSFAFFFPPPSPLLFLCYIHLPSCSG